MTFGFFVHLVTPIQEFVVNMHQNVKHKYRKDLGCLDRPVEVDRWVVRNKWGTEVHIPNHFLDVLKIRKKINNTTKANSKIDIYSLILSSSQKLKSDSHNAES